VKVNQSLSDRINPLSGDRTSGDEDKGITRTIQSMGTKPKVLNLSSPQPFEYDNDSRGTASIRWTSWLKDMELYFEACNIDHKPQQKAILLHLVGDQTRQIYYAKETNHDDYNDVKRILTDHFTPLVNVEFEVFKFGELKQKEGEALDDFVVRLQTQARSCNFGNGNAINAEVKKQIIRGGRCVKLRQRILETQGMTVAQIQEHARIAEASGVQLKAMDKLVNKTDVVFKSEPISTVDRAATGKIERQRIGNRIRINKHKDRLAEHVTNSILTKAFVQQEVGDVWLAKN